MKKPRVKIKLTKLGKRQKQARQNRREAYVKRTGKSPHGRPKPGTLQNSIDFSVEPGKATVFVSGFSGAAKYAEWMEEGPYHLGIGSRNKAASNGMNVGPGFLKRAGDEHQAEIQEILDRNVRDAVQKVRR